MAEGTLYDLIGVAPTSARAQIAHALEARLAGASGDERALLLTVRATLLDPTSRASYNRLHGLQPPATNEERATALASDLAALEREARARQPGSALAELTFLLYLTLVALVISLWLLTLLFLPPLLLPLTTWLLDLYDWGAQAMLITRAGLTLIFAVLAWLALNIFQHALHTTGRFLMICAGVAALLLVAVPRLGRAADGPIGLLLVIVPLFLLAVIIIRWVGSRDLNGLAAAPPRGPRR